MFHQRFARSSRQQCSLVEDRGDILLQDGIALPYTVWDNTTAMGQKLLSDSHAQMMAYQSSVNRTVNGSAATTLPTQAVVALWDASVDWSGGGWHTNVSSCTELLTIFRAIMKLYRKAGSSKRVSNCNVCS